MLVKQAWRLSQTPLALWRQLFKGIYFPEGYFWNVKKGSHPSWGWQSTLVGRDSLVEVKDGQLKIGKSIKIQEEVPGNGCNWWASKL